ncbi:alpha/beta hydrolase [Spirochaetota bacterium]
MKNNSSFTSLTIVLLIALSAGCAGNKPAHADRQKIPIETTQSNKMALQEEFVGIWKGRLSAGVQDLDMSLKVTPLDAYLDVPAQNLKDFKASSLSYERGLLVVEFASFGASMEARLGESDTLDATWKQGGRSFPLSLERVDVASLNGANESEGLKSGYEGLAVTFKSDQIGVELAGTLRLPEGQGPFPCLILISGSGPQDRDESIYGIRPFRDIAEALAAKGWASLRYDDRGVGESGGVFAGATSADFVRDALGAYRFTLADPHIDPKRVGLCGHSEGGYIAPAAENALGGVYALVLLAAPGVSGYEILLDQSADILVAMGASPSDIAAAAAVNKSIYDMVLTPGALPSDAIRTTLSKAGVPENQLDAQIAALSDPWFMAFLKTDPATVVGKVKSPILALNGSKDLQVRADKNLLALKDAASKAEVPFQAELLEGLNHLFQAADTGLPEEYSRLTPRFSPEAMDTIITWLLALPKP